MSVTVRGFTLVTHVATLDVPGHVVEHLSRLLAAHRRRIGTPRGSRALGPFRQAVLVLRWFREGGCVHCLTRDAGISRATGHRHLHEGIDVLADQAPNLHEILDHYRHAGMTHVILDGTLIETDRLAGVRDNDNDWWFNQKHKAFGGNIQFLAALDGARCGSATSNPAPPPDITAARIHALPGPSGGGRRPAHPGRRGLHRRRDRYSPPGPPPEGPVRKALDADTRTTNSLIRGVRALGERAAAEPKQRRRTLQHVTLSPSWIGDIARAALVLNGIWK